jgi:hypothetical protein
MTMARSEDEITQAVAQSEAWMDAVEPAQFPADAVDDRKDLRQIGVALLAIEAAEQSLVAAVAQAKANGRSWTDIANVLGVSRQAARQRFDAQLEAARQAYGALFTAMEVDLVPGARSSLTDHRCSALTAALRRLMGEQPLDSGIGLTGILLACHGTYDAATSAVSGHSRHPEHQHDASSRSDEPNRTG